MEKQRPYYELKRVKRQFSESDSLGSLTGSARDGIRLLRLSDHDVVSVIQSLTMKDFYKSMTSYRDHTVWQDVYQPKFRGIRLYVKFTRSQQSGDFLLISFKQSS